MMLSINESAVRSRAQRAGYVVQKSRRMRSHENYGEFMLIDTETNFAVLGWHYDATLKDIARYLDE